MYSFINTPDDMKWLREVHIGNTSDTRRYKSAVIIGNEDAPERIELYRKRNPDVTDKPMIWKPE